MKRRLLSIALACSMLLALLAMAIPLSATEDPVPQGAEIVPLAEADEDLHLAFEGAMVPFVDYITNTIFTSYDREDPNESIIWQYVMNLHLDDFREYIRIDEDYIEYIDEKYYVPADVFESYVAEHFAVTEGLIEQLHLCEAYTLDGDEYVYYYQYHGGAGGPRDVVCYHGYKQLTDNTYALYAYTVDMMESIPEEDMTDIIEGLDYVTVDDPDFGSASYYITGNYEMTVEYTKGAVLCLTFDEALVPPLHDDEIIVPSTSDTDQPSSEPETVIEFLSAITVYETDCSIEKDENGIYKSYPWPFAGTGIFAVTNEEEYPDGMIMTCSVERMMMRCVGRSLVDLSYSDTQREEPWEVGGTYDAQIYYAVEQSNGEIYEATVDVKVQVKEIPVLEDSFLDGPLTVTEDTIYLASDDMLTYYGRYDWIAAVGSATIAGESYVDRPLIELLELYCQSVLGGQLNYAEVLDDQSATVIWESGNTYDAALLIRYSTEDGEEQPLKIPVKIAVDSEVDLTKCGIASITAAPLTYFETEAGRVFPDFTVTLENGLTTNEVDYDRDENPLPRVPGKYTLELPVMKGNYTVTVSVTVLEIPSEGVWAEGFTWTFDKSTGALIIRGEGTLPQPTDFLYTSLPIRHLIIGEGITAMEDGCIVGLDGYLETLYLPKSLSSLPKLGMFRDTNDLHISRIVLPSTLQALTHYPFRDLSDGNVNAETVYVPRTVTLIDFYSLLSSLGGKAFLAYEGTAEEWDPLSADMLLNWRKLIKLYQTDGTYEQMVYELGYPNDGSLYRDLMMMGEVSYNNGFEEPYEVSVRWIDCDGTLLGSTVLPWGGSATEIPALPEYEGHDTVWDHDGNDIFFDTEINVVRIPRVFTVTWVDENGEVLYTEKVTYGSAPTNKPAVPAKAGYIGAWEENPLSVSADMTVKPVYTPAIVVEEGTVTLPDEIVDVTEGEDVVIDVTVPTQPDQPDPEQPPKAESVVIGSTTVDKITDAGVNVEIKLPDATVSFDKDAMDSIGEQAGDQDVTIVAKEVEKEELNEEQQLALEQQEVHAVLNLEAYAGETQLTQFGGGTVTVGIPFTAPEGKQAEDYCVAHVADDGTITVMPTVYKDGKLVFETTHFSSYVILESAAIDSPNTGDSAVMTLVIAVIAMSGAALTLGKAKRG